MVLCLASMRVYARYKPFIEDKADWFAEFTRWQLFSFSIFTALIIRVSDSF